MTIMEMAAQGDFMQLIMMGIIFIVMIMLLSLLGKGIAARSAADKDKQASASAAPVATRTGNNDAVTAAITAAINEYKKTNK